MTSRLSRRVGKMQQSASIVVDQKVRSLVAAGKDIIGLGSGEPDFDTPENIKQAGVDAIWQGKTKYTAVDGIAELKAAIVEKFRRENELSFRPTQVSVAAGGKQVISNALAATLDAGDEVIVAAPFWMTYPDVIKLWDGEPVIIECPQASGFKLAPEQLEAAITSKTKWVIFNSPSNPAGALYTVAELRSLVQVLRRHPRVNVMSDDIYERLVFDDCRFVTIGQVAPDLAERTLIVNGVSKTYCMTGWRLGYAGGPEDLIGAMAKVQGQSTSAPCSISQYAALEALGGNQEIVAQLRATYQARRDRVVAELNKAPGIECATPQGAFYVYPSCAGTLGKLPPSGARISTDEDFVLALLDCEGVAVVQGAAFGLSPHFRISIAASDEKLAEACARIRRFCTSLR